MQFIAFENPRLRRFGLRRREHYNQDSPLMKLKMHARWSQVELEFDMAFRLCIYMARNIGNKKSLAGITRARIY